MLLLTERHSLVYEFSIMKTHKNEQLSLKSAHYSAFDGRVKSNVPTKHLTIIDLNRIKIIIHPISLLTIQSYIHAIIMKQTDYPISIS